jgi:hypothetical protein
MSSIGMMGKKKKKMQKQKKQEMGGRWGSEGVRFFFSYRGFLQRLFKSSRRVQFSFCTIL